MSANNNKDNKKKVSRTTDQDSDEDVVTFTVEPRKTRSSAAASVTSKSNGKPPAGKAPASPAEGKQTSEFPSDLSSTPVYGPPGYYPPPGYPYPMGHAMPHHQPMGYGPVGSMAYPHSPSMGHYASPPPAMKMPAKEEDDNVSQLSGGSAATSASFRDGNFFCYHCKTKKTRKPKSFRTYENWSSHMVTCHNALCTYERYLAQYGPSNQTAPLSEFGTLEPLNDDEDNEESA
jgi:hypothetical protein